MANSLRQTSTASDKTTENPHTGKLAEPPSDSKATLAIECHNLRKIYDGKVEAVCKIDLEVQRGECFGLLGPNGAGKTTTIEILEGLLKPTSGDVVILGNRWGEHDAALRQKLGISLQETRLSEKLSVRETLRLFRSFYSTGRDPDEILELVSLTTKARSWVGKLSGGQRQRLAIACALVGDPELLFLDEPTTGLDPQSRRQVWKLILDFQNRGKNGSHDHSLHGRGRAPLQPCRHSGQWKDHYRWVSIRAHEKSWRRACD